MDWHIKVTWEPEDKEYAPKRRVSNKGSQNRPHIIGGFYSRKMDRVVEYESMGEYLFYCLLELDVHTVRYYVQPVEVPIPYLDHDGRPAHWDHVPDVLVFRQGFAPHLYQIKDASGDLTEKDERVNAINARYAGELGWGYSIVQPKTVPQVVAQNAKLLMGFMKSRLGYDNLLPELISRLKTLKTSTAIELAKSFQPQHHPFQVLPAIYHLVATGVFTVDINHPISELTTVRIAHTSNQSVDYLSWEGLA